VGCVPFLSIVWQSFLWFHRRIPCCRWFLERSWSEPECWHLIFALSASETKIL